MTVDGKVYEEETIMVAVSNGKFYGGCLMLSQMPI